MPKKEAGQGMNDLYEPISGITVADVARRIDFNKGQTPIIYLAVAPCRTGTTAQLRLFAERGMNAYGQPLKAILRGLVHGEQPQFTIPSEKEIFIKETIGPYTHAESQFDPVQVLLKAGYPIEKIRLLIEMREPLSTFTSWIEKFSHIKSPDELIDNFITAVQTVQGVYKWGIEQGLDPVPYVYEAQRDHEPEVAVIKLLGKLGIIENGTDISKGSELSTIEEGSNIFFPDEPSIFDVPGIHSPVNGGKLGYFLKSGEAIRAHVSPHQSQRLLLAGVHTFYELLRGDTERALGMSVANHHELEVYAGGIIED